MKFLGDNRWLLFVLPGFIALFIASFISDFPKVRDSQLPIVYIALTALSVAIPLLFIHIYGKLKNKTFYAQRIFYSPLVISSIFLCSIVLGFAFGVAHTTDYVSRGLRIVFGEDIILTSSHSELIKVLFKDLQKESFIDGQPNIRGELKEFRSRYAIFSFSEGRRSFEGVVAAFFGGEDRPQVYLSPACIIDGDNTLPIKGPGVWINLEEVEDIQFLYSSCSECAAQLEISAGKSPATDCPFN